MVPMPQCRHHSLVGGHLRLPLDTARGDPPVMVTKLGFSATTAVLALLIGLPGCGRTETALDRKIAAAEEDVAKGGRGLVQLNPAPNEAIRFTWKVEGAPGPFAKVTSSAQYDVINEDECGYIHPVAGTPGRMTTSEPVTLIKVSDTEYSGTVYRDLLQDANYYERGECHWEFTGVAVGFGATGKKGETQFQSFTPASALIPGTISNLYYSARMYPRVADYSGYPADGETELSRFRPEVRDQTFKVAVTTTEEAR